MNTVDLGEPTSFRDHVYPGCTQREYKSNESILVEFKQMLHVTYCQHICTDMVVSFSRFVSSAKHHMYVSR